MTEPHAGQPVVNAGASLDTARAVMIMLHGRGASPENILDLLPRIVRPNVAAIAPAAAGGTWYPNSFMAPRDRNEPEITSGLRVIDGLVRKLVAGGWRHHKIVLLGFSQGACLVSEFALRNPNRYGGVIVLSGGLIGLPGTSWEDVKGSFYGTPMFLGCSDVDAHIPSSRVLETEAVFTRMSAKVTRQLYPGMGHLVNDDEIELIRDILDGVIVAR